MAQPVGSNVSVPVKSAATSKLNWLQLIGAAAMIASYFGLSISAEQQAALLTIIGLGQSLLTFVIRTWFTKSVVASST